MCGTPQGGVLSSRIWNLAFDPLLNHESSCAPVGFADVGALCFRGFCPETLVDIAQPKIDMAVDKTTVVFFSRQTKCHSEVLPRLKKLTINGVDINPSESMTYLGIVLDNKLSWTPHIQKKVSKAKKLLHMIKPAINHIYGLDPIKDAMGLETGSVAQADLWVPCLGAYPHPKTKKKHYSNL